MSSQKTQKHNVEILALIFHFSDCSVLPQATKNEKNQSKALVDNVAPPINPQTLNISEKGRRFEVKKRVTNEDDINEDRNQRRDNKHTMVVINRAFDIVQRTFAQPEFRSSRTMSFIDKTLDTLKSFVNSPQFRSSKTMRYIEKIIDIVKESSKGPEYRSGSQAPNMRTEMIRLQSGQPSLMFEFKPKFFVDVVKRVLSTQLVERFMDDLAHAQHKSQRHKARYP